MDQYFVAPSLKSKLGVGVAHVFFYFRVCHPFDSITAFDTQKSTFYAIPKADLANVHVLHVLNFFLAVNEKQK